MAQTEQTIKLNTQNKSKWFFSGLCTVCLFDLVYGAHARAREWNMCEIVCFRAGSNLSHWSKWCVQPLWAVWLSQAAGHLVVLARVTCRPKDWGLFQSRRREKKRIFDVEQNQYERTIMIRTHRKIPKMIGREGNKYTNSTKPNNNGTDHFVYYIKKRRNIETKTHALQTKQRCLFCVECNFLWHGEKSTLRTSAMKKPTAEWSEHRHWQCKRLANKKRSFVARKQRQYCHWPRCIVIGWLHILARYTRATNPQNWHSLHH